MVRESEGTSFVRRRFGKRLHGAGSNFQEIKSRVQRCRMAYDVAAVTSVRVLSLK
ncbi:MAG: hypothetical protein WD971_06485 [Pirellulales bacterium]